MKTAKEVARELKINYEDLLGVLAILGIPKMFGMYRLTEKQIDRIKRFKKKNSFASSG